MVAGMVAGCQIGRHEAHCVRRVTEANKYFKGQLLLDNGSLGGSFFQRTVVLVCQHDAEGAFGLVLNRSSGNKLGELVVADLPDEFKIQPALSRRPRATFRPRAFFTPMNFFPRPASCRTSNLGHSLDSLVEIGESFSPTKKIKTFAGYAGWSPGQLEDEMKRDAWLTHPASLELVFDMDPARLWKHVLSQKGLKYRLIAEIPRTRRGIKPPHRFTPPRLAPPLFPRP